MSLEVEPRLTPSAKAARLQTLQEVRDYARSIRLSYGGGGQQVMDDLRLWLDARVYETATG